MATCDQPQDVEEVAVADEAAHRLAAPAPARRARFRASDRRSSGPGRLERAAGGSWLPALARANLRRASVPECGARPRLRSDRRKRAASALCRAAGPGRRGPALRTPCGGRCGRCRRAFRSAAGAFGVLACRPISSAARPRTSSLGSLAKAQRAARASASGRRAASGRGLAGDSAADWRPCGRRRAGSCPSSAPICLRRAAMFCRAQLLPGCGWRMTAVRPVPMSVHVLGHLALPGDAINAAAGAAAAGAEIQPAVGADVEVGHVERIAFEEHFAAWRCSVAPLRLSLTARIWPCDQSAVNSAPW